jgi:hypothetical protein
MDVLAARSSALAQQVGRGLGGRKVKHGGDIAELRVGIQDDNSLAGFTVQG